MSRKPDQCQGCFQERADIWHHPHAKLWLCPSCCDREDAVSEDDRRRADELEDQRRELEADMYQGMREPWDGAEPDREPTK